MQSIDSIKADAHETGKELVSIKEEINLNIK